MCFSILWLLAWWQAVVSVMLRAKTPNRKYAVFQRQILGPPQPLESEEGIPERESLKFCVKTLPKSPETWMHGADSRQPS